MLCLLFSLWDYNRISFHRWTQYTCTSDTTKASIGTTGSTYASLQVHHPNNNSKHNPNLATFQIESWHHERDRPRDSMEC